jgi:hypothetical protein
VGQGHFAGEAREAGALFGGGSRLAQIFIDGDNLLFGPAQLAGALGKSVLTGGGFPIMFHWDSVD